MHLWGQLLRWFLGLRGVFRPRVGWWSAARLHSPAGPAYRVSDAGESVHSALHTWFTCILRLHQMLRCRWISAQLIHLSMNIRCAHDSHQRVRFSQMVHFQSPLWCPQLEDIKVCVKLWQNLNLCSQTFLTLHCLSPSPSLLPNLHLIYIWVAPKCASLHLSYSTPTP